MPDRVYIPLKTDGSKRPAISGWNRSDYHCTKEEALEQSPWIGLRADGLVIVDCDTAEAAQTWLERTGQTDELPLATRTPRGWHFFYETGPDSPSGPAVGVLPKTDIRAGRGSYVVDAESPGYAVVDGNLGPFDPSWLPRREVPGPGEGPSSPPSDLGWDTIPDGQRNMTLTAIAGSIWRQGISQEKFGALVLALNNALCSPPLPRDEVAVIVRSVSRYEQTPDEVYELDEGVEELEARDPAASIWLDAHDFGPPPPRTWLWEPYVPDTTLTLVSGREGIGKGMFCAWMASCVARGLRPGTGEKVDPRPVAWLTAEDDAHDDVWPRLRAAGWDPDNPEHERIRFLDPTVMMKLPEDTQAFEKALRMVDPGLVIMDPGRSYFGRHDGRQISFNEEADVRPAMVEILGIAKRMRVPILFVAHWRKGTGESRDMTSGTGAWKQVSRHCLDFAESEDESAKAFWVGKTNLAQKGHVTGYHMVPVHEFDSAKFVLDGLLPFTTLDKWLETAKHAKYEIDGYDEVVAWIEQNLDEDRAIPKREIIAEGAGVSVYKVKKLLAELEEEGRLEPRQGLRSIWRG